MGHTLTLDLPDHLYESLVETARQRGQSPEAVAAQWLMSAAHQSEGDPIEPFIGALDSGGSDWADAHDRYVGTAGIAPTAPPQPG